MKIKSVSVEIDLKDADVLIQALESLWDNEILIPQREGEGLDEEKQELSKNISLLTDEMYRIFSILGGEDEKQNIKN